MIVTSFIDFLFHRKRLFKEKINMVHLNLVIALLFGLIVFVGGVETAINFEVRVAIHVNMHSKQFSWHFL